MLDKTPFKAAQRGSVYAVRFGPAHWGFVRFRNTSGFGVVPVYARKSGMPKVAWADDLERWFGHELSGPEKYDLDDFVLVGTRPFDDPAARGPDQYQVPQYPWQPWVIFRRDGLVHVKGPDDVVGLQESRILNADGVRRRIVQRYANRELAEVEVEVEPG